MDQEQKNSRQGSPRKISVLPSEAGSERLNTASDKQSRDEKHQIVIQGVERSESMSIRKCLLGFQRFDENGDGAISQAELKEVLRGLDAEITDAEIRQIISSVDKDGDDSVSFHEYMILAKKLSEAHTKSKGKATRIPRVYLEPHVHQQYTSLFRQAAGEDASVDLHELKEFFATKNINIPDDRLKAIMDEVDDDRSGQLELEEFLVLLIKAMGMKKRKVGPEVCPAVTLKNEGWALGELRKIGYDCPSLQEAGFSTEELMDVFTARELHKSEVPVSELLAAGWDCRGAREAGFHVAELVAAGASVRQLRRAGFTDLPSVVGMRKKGVDALRMKQGGFSLSELRNGGYSAAELHLAGFSRASLTALQRLHNHVKHLPALERQSTMDIRREAEQRYIEAQKNV